jgi:hypothetical protein
VAAPDLICFANRHNQSTATTNRRQPRQQLQVKGPLVNDFIVIPAFAGMTNKSELTQVDKYYFFTTVAPST